MTGTSARLDLPLLHSAPGSRWMRFVAAVAGLFVYTCAYVALLMAYIAVAARPNRRATPLLRTGSVGALTGLAVLVMARDIGTLVVAMAIIGFSLGLIGPANLGLEVLPSRQQ